MSDEYEQYAEWESKQADVKAGRYDYSKMDYTRREGPAKKAPPTVYKDEKGREFIITDGKRDYIDE